MNRSEIKEQLTVIFRTVFEDPKLDLRDSMTKNDIEMWDSLTYLMMIAAVEKQFNFKFKLLELGNLERKEEILSYSTLGKITGEQFYQLQFDVIKTKIKALDYMFSLTDFKNKGIIKFKEDKKKKILNISLDKKRTNIVIDWNLLGIKNIELEIKK